MNPDITGHTSTKRLNKITVTTLNLFISYVTKTYTERKLLLNDEKLHIQNVSVQNKFEQKWVRRELVLLGSVQKLQHLHSFVNLCFSF